MRIGIDALSLQSPGSRGRGVGRFGENLVAGLLGLGRGHEFVLYVHDGYPDDRVPKAPNATRVPVAPDPARGERKMRDAMERIARTNPQKVDALLLIHPFELCPGYDPPARPLNGPALVSVVHDLIPFLFPEQYLTDRGNAAWNYRRLRTLRHYDALLTNSESTRDDCLRVIGLPADRVVTIGGAADGSYFRPDRGEPLPALTTKVFDRYGVRKPFLFSLIGDDPRKNAVGLVEAFAGLAPGLRGKFQLVITCYFREENARKLREHARACGLSDDDLILTGAADDEEVRVFYQRCAAFVFPSRYEGLGLPLLEAMHCGAAVVAGQNSSQVEVVGDAGFLVDVDDPSALAKALSDVVQDPVLTRSLGEKGMARARMFTWEQTAGRALDALTRVVSRPYRTPKPRIAVFAAWPPKTSAVAGRAVELVNALKDDYAIDLYHEPGYVPHAAVRSAEFASYDYRLFRRNAAILGYRSVVHVHDPGNPDARICAVLRGHPGVVTGHDLESVRRGAGSSLAASLQE